jgi:hypothetical protein
MKALLAMAPLCLLSLSLAAGQEASNTTSVEDQIKKHEQNWAQATVEEGAAAVDQYEVEGAIMLSAAATGGHLSRRASTPALTIDW